MSRRYVHARSVAVVLAALAATMITATADGTPPGKNGRIVFERLRFQNAPIWGELFVMSADGSSVFKLTHPPSGTEDTNADWSPDGARVVFARAPAVGAHSVWTVNADGSDPHRLTPACPPGGGIPSCAADDGWPVWSPDGKHIVLQRLAGALRPKGSTVNTAKAIYKRTSSSSSTRTVSMRALLSGSGRGAATRKHRPGRQTASGSFSSANT